MTMDTFTTEQIHAITDRALQEGRIPSPDACDEYGQPLLTWEAFAARFGLTRAGTAESMRCRSQ
ncbi:MAG: hypothetical protein IPL99_11495 [Candidatus Competibacteraceae bacterium]|nr:hypothetical protein [Candidatus Competibacteraceae bacterium]